VLHTRLRYALFVPWIYQTLYEQGPITRAAASLQKLEVRLAGRLKFGNSRGVIGGLNYPEPTSQPPSVSYWAALGTWGILKQQDGRVPSRAFVHNLLLSKHRKANDDDGQAMSAAELPFVALPPRPQDWSGSDPMKFDLSKREAQFFHRQLSELHPLRSPDHLSLLARLTLSGTVEADHCWASGIVEIAKDDGPRLRRAGHAASLAAVGRAIYAALVETLQEEEDNLPNSGRHRKNLPTVLEEHGGIASRTNVSELIADTGLIPSAVVEVLEQTIAWLGNGANNPMALRDAYEHAECNRKQQRARLSRLYGASRRLEWKNEEHALAEPLHYRWRQVSGLLHDLWAAA
jgi:hypothetical protein